MNWKKRWKSELDSEISKFSDNVFSAPVTSQVGQNSVGALKINKKSIISISTIALALLLSVILMCSWFIKKPQPLNENVFVIQINPSAAFVVDGNDKVKSVSSLNFDADVILSDQQNKSNIIGKSVQEAANFFVESAAKYGYIDIADITLHQNAAAIKITSYGQKDFEFLRSSIESELSKNGIPSVVLWNKSESKSDFNNLLGIDEAKEDIIGELKKMSNTYAERVVGDIDKITAYSQNLLDGLEQLSPGSAIFIRNVIEQYLNGELQNVEEFISEVMNGLSSLKEIRKLQFAFLYDIPRQPIGKEQLEEIHGKIVDDNGSLEDFFNNRGQKK